MWLIWLTKLIFHTITYNRNHITFTAQCDSGPLKSSIKCIYFQYFGVCNSKNIFIRWKMEFSIPHENIFTIGIAWALHS
jgi:hypothetical protein